MKINNFGMLFDSPLSYKGGINYYKNFSFALKKVNPNIKLLLFVSNSYSKIELKDFGNEFEIIKLSVLRRYSLKWFLDKIFIKFFKSSIIKIYQLKKYKIDILFTYSSIQASKFFKIYFWLPDLQFLHLPNLFTKHQIIYNKKLINYMYKQSEKFILSSHSASKDLQYILGRKLNKVHVIHFVSQPFTNSYDTIKTLNYLQKKYNFKKPYFFLPNQFWKHKNHIAAFNAIKQNNSDEYILICTGDTTDFRDKNSDHFKFLTNYIISNKLNEKIRVLGMIPYKDVISLMKYSLGVINPSFFEGWSSSVQEAKSMHKIIILSDIDVHREQIPKHGYFFNPNNFQELSKHLNEIFYHKKKDNKYAYSLNKETINFGNEIKKIIYNF